MKPWRPAWQIALAGALLVSACGSETAGDVSPTAPSPSPSPVTETPAPQPSAPGTAPAALTSKDCGAVVAFYTSALASHDFARAVQVWNDPAIDADTLEAAYGTFDTFFQPSPPNVEGAAGSLYCTVELELGDSGDPDGPTRSETLQLRRVNDVPGATPDQLRWTVRSSTLIENP